uniref:Uncharacterized protein n=1 Tax=Meloidogyne enterolobii TaxID=390850 RepID=A0A6V7X4U7_MELEN|nr:unnamed protein product [Meloidogyne enterolobii]
MDSRRAILGIYDVLREINSESCIIYGNSKLNELYTLKLGLEKEENFEIFERLRSGKKITNNNELIEIKEQIEEIRLVNHEIFNKHLDEDQNFKNKFEEIQNEKEVGKIMYDLVIPSKNKKQKQNFIKCPTEGIKQDKPQEIKIIEEFLTKEKVKEIDIKKVEINSLIWHYDYNTRGVINNLSTSEKKIVLTQKLKLLSIKDEKEKLCLLYFFVESTLKKY